MQLFPIHYALAFSLLVCGLWYTNARAESLQPLGETAKGASLTIPDMVDEAKDLTGILLVPGAVSIGFTAALAARPLATLKENLKRAGYQDVQIVGYKNVLTATREEMERSLEEEINALTDQQKSYTIIAHSMGHYVALAAILNGSLKARVTKLVGLAGAARGGNRAPFGCGSFFLQHLFAKPRDPEEKCPGLRGLMQGRPSYIVDTMLVEKRDRLERIEKCAVAVKGDKMLKPYDSGFLPGSDNFTIDFAGHTNLPSHDRTVRFLQENCGF